MRSSSPSFLFATLAAACFLLFSALCGVELQGAAKAVERRAARILRNASNTLAAAKTFRLRMSISQKVKADGKENQFGVKYTLSVARPDKMMLTCVDGDGPTVVCDGKRLSVCIPALKKYAQWRAIGELHELYLPGTEAEFMLRRSGLLFLKDFLDRKPLVSLTQSVSSVAAIGSERIDSRLCHRLEFRGKGEDQRVWINRGEAPLIHRLSVQILRPRRGKSPVQIDVVRDLSDWKTNLKLPADTFVFKPPADAQAVAVFIPREHPGAHPLLGREAPDFKLRLLNGSKLDMAKLKGKGIVILDFWASWCGPCAVAMPEVAAVADSYPRRDVRLIAINQGENFRAIRSYLKATGLKVEVAVDTAAATRELYGARGLPHLVVIGKDGKIRYIHTGYSAYLQVQLRRQIDSLLAGHGGEISP